MPQQYDGKAVPEYQLSPEMILKLKNIYYYFGGGSVIESFENKLERLFLESGEYRDAISMKLHPKIRNKEITDIISCGLQLLFFNTSIQEQLDDTVDETLKKINSGYYK